MPAILVPIAVFLAQIFKPLVARVLAALGMGLITYQGVTALTDQLRQAIGERFGGLAEDIAAIVGMLGIDTAMTIILSAYLAVLTINGIRNGATRLGSISGG